MKRGGLLERNAAAGFSQLGHYYRVVTPAEIVKAGGELTFQAPMTKFFVRSGFPCRIDLDGVTVANDVDVSPYFLCHRDVKKITVRLHGGNSGTDAYGQHANLVVEGVSGEQLEHVLPDPRYLPSHAWTQPSQTHASGQTLKEWATATATVFDVNGKMPKEVWLTSICLKRTTSAAEVFNNSVVRLQVEKEDLPVGDVERLFDLFPPVALGGASWDSNSCYWPLPFAHIDVASLGAQYAAESPAIRFKVRTNSVGSATDLHLTMNGCYRM